MDIFQNMSDLFHNISDDGRDVRRLRLSIDGKWDESAERTYFELFTPIDGTLLAYVSKACDADVERAVTAAKTQQRRIRDIAAIERIEIFRQTSQILEDRLEDFVTALIYEAGKPRRDAEAEVKATVMRLRLTMEEVKKISGEYIPGDWSEDTRSKITLVIREPVGVVAAISPFNYPLFIQAAKVIPALLAGNSVMLNPQVQLLYQL
jgi:glyceraldehyde-3-phosphate dehydrogenase [NAD(P)+]